VAAPSALVEARLNFDKNPRLENGRGFFLLACDRGTPKVVAGHKLKDRHEQNS
jgi:hypothetical protein